MFVRGEVLSIYVIQGLSNVQSYTTTISIPIAAEYIVSLNVNLAVGNCFMYFCFVQSKYVTAEYKEMMRVNHGYNGYAGHCACVGSSC